MSRPTDRPQTSRRKNSGSGTKQNVFLTLICMSYWALPGRDMVARSVLFGMCCKTLGQNRTQDFFRRSPCLRYYPFVPECTCCSSHRRSLAFLISGFLLCDVIVSSGCQMSGRIGSDTDPSIYLMSSGQLSRIVGPISADRIVCIPDALSRSLGREANR